MSGGKTLFGKSHAKPPSAPDEICAFLGKETLFEGKMTFHGIFRLDGKFEGEIFESGTLIVGESAVVRGKVGVNTIIINGTVEGEVHAEERVEIHPTGILLGTLVTPVLSVNEGAILDGHCSMEKRQKQKSDLHPHSPEMDHSVLV